MIHPGITNIIIATRSCIKSFLSEKAYHGATSSAFSSGVTVTSWISGFDDSGSVTGSDVTVTLVSSFFVSDAVSTGTEVFTISPSDSFSSVDDVCIFSVSCPSTSLLQQCRLKH